MAKRMSGDTWQGLQILGLLLIPLFGIYAAISFHDASVKTAHATARVGWVSHQHMTLIFSDKSGIVHWVDFDCSDGGTNDDCAQKSGDRIAIAYDPANPSDADYATGSSPGFSWGLVGMSVSGLALLLAGFYANADSRRVRTQEWLRRHPKRASSLPPYPLPTGVDATAISALEGRRIGPAPRGARQRLPSSVVSVAKSPFTLRPRPATAATWGTPENPWIFRGISGGGRSSTVMNAFYWLTPDGRDITGYAHSSIRSWVLPLLGIAACWVIGTVTWVAVTGDTYGLFTLMAAFVFGFLALLILISSRSTARQERTLGECGLRAIFHTVADVDPDTVQLWENRPAADPSSTGRP